MSDKEDEREVDYDLYDYKLVKFCDETSSGRTSADIDIVYKDWVYFNLESGQSETFFPAPPYGPMKRQVLYDKLQKKEPKHPKWLSYKIEIVGHASELILLNCCELYKI